MFKMFLLAVLFAVAGAALNDIGGFPTVVQVCTAAALVCVFGWVIGLLVNILR